RRDRRARARGDERSARNDWTFRVAPTPPRSNRDFELRAHRDRSPSPGGLRDADTDLTFHEVNILFSQAGRLARTPLQSKSETTIFSFAVCAAATSSAAAARERWSQLGVCATGISRLPADC